LCHPLPSLCRVVVPPVAFSVAFSIAFAARRQGAMVCQLVCDRWRSVGRSTYFTSSQVGYLARRVFSEKTSFFDHDDTP
jgi:hypothetical protein